MEGIYAQVAFWILALITIFSALMVATLNNLSRAVVFLVFFFLGASGIYFLLQAEFLALMQVMIYAGAISVLFGFIIMLKPQLPGAWVKQSLNQGVGALLGGVFLIFLLLSLSSVKDFNNEILTSSITLKDIGQLLLGRYLLPFELVSVLLLVALIAAILYTKNPSIKGEKPYESD